jgi:hypothetical protein
MPRLASRWAIGLPRPVLDQFALEDEWSDVTPVIRGPARKAVNFAYDVRSFPFG